MNLVRCPTFGCCGCEHTAPHVVDSCPNTSCDGGGDYNCPPCEEIEKEEIEKVEKMK